MGAFASCLQDDKPIITVDGRRLAWREVLGEGAFSFVELRADAATGELFALKRVLLRDDDAGADARQEARLLSACDHAHIVRIEGETSLTPTAERPLPELCLLLELCAGGRLPEALARRGPRLLSELEALTAFRGIADAVAYLHARSVIHLDIKPENVLLSAPADLSDPTTSLPLLKLCDFGSALTAPVLIAPSGRGMAATQERLDSVTTLAYRSPELADLHAAADRGVTEVGAPADVWALGILLYRLAYLQMPFADNRLAILKGEFAFPQGGPPSSAPFRALICAMLEVDPAERITAAQAVRRVDELQAQLRRGH